MKVIELDKVQLDLPTLLKLALQEPLLLVTPSGEEFVVSEADVFDDEVELLRSSTAFQRFLEDRSAEKDVITLDELEQLLAVDN